VGTLLLLTAVVAIGLGGVRTLVVESDRIALDAVGQSGTTPAPSSVASAIAGWQQRREEAGLRALGGAMVGLLVGIGIGVTRPRPVLATLLGSLVGWFVGGVAAGFLSQPENLPVVGIGSALLLLMGGVFYVLSSRRAGGG
jgi:hypothetical protein